MVRRLGIGCVLSATTLTTLCIIALIVHPTEVLPLRWLIAAAVAAAILWLGAIGAACTVHVVSVLTREQTTRAVARDNAKTVLKAVGMGD